MYRFSKNRSKYSLKNKELLTHKTNCTNVKNLLKSKKEAKNKHL